MGWQTYKLNCLNDIPEPTIGDGISRPMPGEKTRGWDLIVRFPQGKPMFVMLLAATPELALKYAGNRWPLGKASLYVYSRAGGAE